MVKNNALQNHTRAKQLKSIGTKILRYGLAIVLIWIGILKFTSYEASGIKGLVENSPFLSWTYGVFGVEGFSKVLGVIEIGTGLMISCRPFNAKISAWGSIAAIITFLVTLTFLFSTPGIIQEDYSFPFISPMPGQFILKDIVLLGAAIWTAGEAIDSAVESNSIGSPAI
ncbi:MAG: DUF417 family protein [Chitinophagaceae bacterium]